MSKKTALIIISSVIAGGAIVSLSLYGRNISETRGALAQEDGGDLASLDSTTSDLESELGTNLSTEEELKIEQSKIEAAQKEWDKLNSTQKLSQDLFAKYLFLKQNGQEITPEIQSALIDNVIKENVKQVEYKTYTASNIKVSSDETAIYAETYGETLGKILFDNSPKNTPSELVLLAGLIENGPNESDVAGLKLIADSYRLIVKKYLALTVPKTAQTLHLKLVNTMSALATNIETFSNIEADPIFAAANVNPYNQNFETLVSLLGQFRDYFEQKGVVFNTSGAGYAFTHLDQ